MATCEEVVECHTRESQEHHTSREYDRIDDRWVDDECYDDDTQEHDTRSEKCRHDEWIRMLRMDLALARHSERRRSRRYESSDRTRCDDTSTIPDHLREYISGILYSCHHHDEEPYLIWIEEFLYEYRMCPVHPSWVEPVHHIQKWVLDVWENRQYNECDDRELQGVTELLARDTLLQSGEVLLRREKQEEKYREHDGDRILPSHSDHTDEVCDQCRVLTRSTHTILPKRRVCVAQKDEESWEYRSEEDPDVSTILHIEPRSDRSEKCYRTKCTNPSKSCSHWWSTSSPWKLSLSTDKSAESDREDKVDKYRWFHRK